MNQLFYQALYGSLIEIQINGLSVARGASGQVLIEHSAMRSIVKSGLLKSLAKLPMKSVAWISALLHLPIMGYTAVCSSWF